MRFAKIAAIVVALSTIAVASAFADDNTNTNTNTTTTTVNTAETTTASDLRGSADAAANAGKAEAQTNTDKKVVETVAETVAGGGEVLPSADSDVSDGVDSIDEAKEAVSLLVKAFNDKNWMLFTGILLMLLIFGLRYFKVTDKLGIEGKGLLAFSISLGVITSVAVELTLVGGAFSWAKLGGAVGVGVMEGLIASGAWEAAKSHLKGLTA